MAGNAVCDDGLMIDLPKMKDVEVDVEKQRAFLGAGCTLADFDAAANGMGSQRRRVSIPPQAPRV